MTKRELFEAFDGGIFRDDVHTAEIYEKYYPQISDLLWFMPDNTEIRYRNGVLPASIANFPKDFEIYLRDRSTSKQGLAEIETLMRNICSDLRTWVRDFSQGSSSESRINAVRADWYRRRPSDKKQIFFYIFFITIGIVAIAATVLTVLETFGVVAGGGKISGVVGAVGFSVDVLAFVTERIMDMRSRREFEAEAAAALSEGEKGAERFETEHGATYVNSKVSHGTFVDKSRNIDNSTTVNHYVTNAPSETSERDRTR